jgi:hypothetical protein
MTALASWIAKDVHGDTSLYIATDSRLSSVLADGSFGAPYTDSYQKTFYSSTTPDIFGIYGIVTCAPVIIARIVPMLAGSRESIKTDQNPQSVYCERLKQDIESCPLPKVTHAHAFSVVHGMRFDEKDFFVARHEIKIDPSGVSVNTSQIPMPATAAFHCSWGSGADSIEEVRRDSVNDDASGLSRWHWQTFHDATASRADNFSGAPACRTLSKREWTQFWGLF